MDVTIATDSPGLAWFLGDRFNRRHDIALGLSLRIEVLNLPKGFSRKDGACPCPKVFGSKVLSSYFPQVVIYITRINCSGLVFLVNILKKLLSRQILTLIDDF